MASSVFTAVIDEMTGATSSTPGLAGLVPAPAAGDEDKVLHGDGTWGEVQASGGTLRIVPFSIGANSWTLTNGLYIATYSSAYVTATSVEFVEYSDSFRQAIRGDLSWAKATGNGGITFTTTVQPVGTLQGEIRIIDNDDGAVAIITQQTALPTIRDVPFTVVVADWSLNNDGLYEAVFQSPFISTTSHDFVEFNESIENATDGIKVGKAENSGTVVGLKFTSRRVPAGAVSGTVTPLDNADGKVAVALQDTVMPIANGGTGANTLQGAQDALGITELRNSLPSVVFNEGPVNNTYTVQVEGTYLITYHIYCGTSVSRSTCFVKINETNFLEMTLVQNSSSDVLGVTHLNAGDVITFTKGSGTGYSSYDNDHATIIRIGI